MFSDLRSLESRSMRRYFISATLDTAHHFIHLTHLLHSLVDSSKHRKGFVVRSLSSVSWCLETRIWPRLKDSPRSAR
jgi:hypothetical protein